MKNSKFEFSKISFILIMLFVMIFSQISASDLEVFSLTRTALPGAKTDIILVWNEIEDIDGMNIYRKTSLFDSYPRAALNLAPITIMTDCDEINELIPSDSEEWQILSNLAWNKPKSKGGYDVFIDPSIFIRPATFDPCVLATLEPSSSLWEQVQFLARRFPSISTVLGQAYIDKKPNAGTDYWYEFRAVADGSESVLVSDVRVTAGVHIPLPAPTNIQVTAGDSEVLITWDSVNNAFGYNVYRKIIPHGSAMKINDAPVMAVITQDLEGDSISATMGLVDFRRWDETGTPIAHDVDGTPVTGPVNGIHYKYQVIALDGLEIAGTASPFSAMVIPQDTTAPGLPGDLKVEAVGQTLKITWSKVLKDKLGRLEMDGISGYNIYRSATQNDPTPLKINLALLPQPAGTEVMIVDSDPAIISHYGDVEFYYRIDCTDVHGNKGEMSSTASGYVPDIYPPDPPVNTSAAGFQEYIRTYWDLNTEPDIYSYEIYRSLCHLGEWMDPRQQEKLEISSGDFVLVGEITHREAEEISGEYGQPYWEDYTVPAGSPLCYAYWIKARDGSQNLSGNWPYPSTAEKSLIVCQRLRDETPPPPPIITAVQARDEAVYLEWVAAPSQDLGVFHIFRSLKETTDYVWIGGITVEEPPATPVVLTAPFAPSSPCDCDDIPLVAHEGMNAGSFTDKNADPKTVYYYKVLSVDQNGNESKIEEAIPYSTFTFKISGPVAPSITSITGLSESCGLHLVWTPNFDAAHHKGFVIFRSSSEFGIYRQISDILVKSEYVDLLINKNVNYWYKVQSYDLQGRPSVLSASYKAKCE